MYTTILTYSLRGRFDDDESTRVRDLFCRVVGSIVVLFDAMSPISLAMMLEEQRRSLQRCSVSIQSGTFQKGRPG
jgi:hypothetical protein